MVELIRTHPMHLAGTSGYSANSARAFYPGLDGRATFGNILEGTLEKTHLTPSGQGNTVSHASGFLDKGSPSQPSGPVSVKDSPLDANPFHADPFLPIPPENSDSFTPFIEEASKAFGVDKELIQAVIKAESDFNPLAKSSKGALGLMQLMPSTGREMGVRDFYDPRDNILGGTRYLAMLLNHYQGDRELALAAYNWGPGNVERLPESLPSETETYVRKVLRYLETLTA